MTSATVTQPTGGIPAPIRRAIKLMVLDLRGALQEDFTIQLRAMGIAASGVGPVPGGRALPPADARARELAVAVIEREREAGASHADALGRYVRESAFTFLNRLVGLRCLEARGLLLVDGLTETVVKIDLASNASSLYRRVRSEQRAAQPRELWRETLRRAYTAVTEQVRVLFDPDSEYAALLPQQATLQRVLDALNNTATIPTDTWAQDETLGWIYQYFNADEKDRIFASKKKIAAEEIIPVTQLYTERYMVDYLLQNTLGTLWTELHPDTRLRQGWPYYVTPPADNAPVVRTPRRLRDITLLDPCCGSGHFLTRAFDLLVEMYAEEGLERAVDVPGLILERNLYGIDIDLRAVQIAALGLYMKARTLAGPGFRPTRLNLLAADANLPGDAPPERYMRRFGDDRELAGLVRELWTGLRNVRELGSLLHPERPIDALIARRKQTHQMEFGQFAPDEDRWDRYKYELLGGLREEFEHHGESTELSQRLFGQDAAKGINLVEALGRRYDIVLTNPPYMGSGNMGSELKKFVEREYRDGKRDLYAAFIHRCREFSNDGGLVGMVTQQAWLFLSSYSNLRKNVLERTSIETIIHLGEHGFDDSAAAGAFVILFSLRASLPIKDHRLIAFRLVGPKTTSGKITLLHQALENRVSGIIFEPYQSPFLDIPGIPLTYWLRDRFVAMLHESTLKDTGSVLEGLHTEDSDRFVRFCWECSNVSTRWFNYVKGGGYSKWLGFTSYRVDWANNGQAIRSAKAIVPSSHMYFKSGLTYSMIARGSLGVRLLDNAVFTNSGPAIFVGNRLAVAAVLNSRVSSYLLRAINSKLSFDKGYVERVPMPPPEQMRHLTTKAHQCILLKRMLVEQDPIEGIFVRLLSESPGSSVRATVKKSLEHQELIAALLHTQEGHIEQIVSTLFSLSSDDEQAVMSETGKPSGWYPLVSGYDALPQKLHPLSSSATLVPGLQIHTSHDLHIEVSASLQDRLRSSYKQDHADLLERPTAVVEDTDRDSEPVNGARITIPVETRLENLAQRLEIHPLSIYWLLQELREKEELNNLPEIKRELEDWTSVSLLRILGYRWPEQDAYEREHGPILDSVMVDEDGIIPLVRCYPGQPTAAERVGMRLERDFGPDERETSEREFRQYVGRDLETWVKRDFFKRHVQQFKSRPIAWHFVSPERTFEALVLYHRLNRETLQKLRTQYAGGLIERLRAEQEQARGRGETARVSELGVKIEDVEEFRQRLERIERGDELKYRIRCRWKGEEETGRPGPYAPDIDDGVKVNIRPFQEAGLLAMKDVIKKW